MHPRVLFALPAALALTLGGCGGDSGSAAPAVPGMQTGAANLSNPLAVVATTTQLQDFAQVVGGDRVDLTGILRPGIEAHDYEPSPADVVAMGDAQVLLTNGVGLEEWLDSTVDSSGYDGPVVDTSEGVTIREGDPHIWHDPANAQIMVANIADAFVEADPSGGDTYRANAAAYTEELTALDAEVTEQISALPNKKLVTNHEAFGYYTDAYGLEFIGAIIPSFDSSAELSGKEVSDLVAEIRATGTTAVFSESSLPADTASTVGEEAGVTVVAGEDALYGDTLGEPGSPGETYLGMIRHNTQTIVDGLSG